ncbi:MAG: bifunctional phosphoribosylaminoimidazolecarboxamide formyltransferase/IMP cyclohydrolase [Acidobacteriota bacterium]
MQAVRRALLSVSDKEGLVELGQGLQELGVEIVSTGGTARTLEEAGLTVLKVSEATGFPEILDGRVKTLHPKIHGGILADRSRANHLSELNEHDIHPIDLVVVNLYPFEQTVNSGAGYGEAVETIDIGGPCMLRAAAKNHHSVLAVVDPADYPRLLEILQQGDDEALEGLRRELAIKAFRHTRDYDAAIAAWLERENEKHRPAEDEVFPRRLTVALSKAHTPRYGENPHQQAAVYRYTGGQGLFGGYEQLQGKELSWNNLLDADATRKMASAFGSREDTGESVVAIVKHNNPCGIGRGGSVLEAYQRALATDSTSAFGSIIAVNGPLDGEAAAKMKELFIEVILAPEFSEEAREIFAKKKNLRLLQCPLFTPESAVGHDLRSVDGGFLAQQLDAESEDPASWKIVTKRKPKKVEREALAFAWTVCRFVKSNAIVVTNRNQTVGLGAGQMSRVDSCRLALEKAQLDLAGCVAASDAFFPFRDGLDVLAKAGIKAVIQPGGSKRDDEVIAAADEQGLSMLFTGQRHFRH